MKRIFYLLAFAAMAVVMGYRPVMAEESGLKDQKGYKDECLLVAINCGNEIITLDQKIDKLQKEIAKGTTVYTDDELRILREQLHNARKTQEYFKFDGASNRYRFPGE